MYFHIFAHSFSHQPFTFKLTFDEAVSAYCISFGLTITMGVSYSSVPVGSNVCFVNSSQRLELAVNYGNFSGKFNISASSKIAIIK